MMRLKLVLSALPSLEEDPLDENNREFQEALQVSYAADNKYREFIDNIDSDNDENAFEKLAEADRELKDRTRELLGVCPEDYFAGGKIPRHACEESWHRTKFRAASARLPSP